VQAHERIVNYYNKMNAIRTIAPYVVSVVFAIVGALLILLAPESRSTAANFAAAALLVLAMGIAGFTRFHAKAPGLDINAEKSARSNMTQAVAADRTKAQRSGRVRKT
jgi:hypothetical protein